MPARAVKRVAQRLCAPALRDAARRCSRLFRPRPAEPPPPPPPPYRLLSTLEQVDAEFARVRRAATHDEFLRIQDGFRLRYPPDLPSDPASAEYRDTQLAFYRLISGRHGYDAAACEQFELNDDARTNPFPYYTRSCVTVGEQLMAIGFLVRALAFPPGGRVLEFGFGYGLLTTELARTGFRVTGVDINPQYRDLVAGTCRRHGLAVDLVLSPMLDYRGPAEGFDRVVFYESFHHRADHEAMVARLGGLVAPGGAVVFGGEPITDDFPVPWGVRTDGRSLWAIRTQGWLELGFRTDYFPGLLARHGWSAEVHGSADVPWQRVFVARRA
ncbi:MAG: hypothetical protein C0501_25070 [Isosphaera sp.]|nr:hypothetical protein [Isosphaera sp.]